MYKQIIQKGSNINTTTIKPPHGWVGGKSKLAKQIVTLIPQKHNLFVEVFGGASVLIQNYCKNILMNFL